MISLLQWRSDVLLGLAPEHGLERGHHALDVAPRGDIKHSVDALEATTQVIRHLPSTLQLELVGNREHVDHFLWVLGRDNEVVHIHSYVLVVVSHITHPNVRLSSRWKVSF